MPTIFIQNGYRVSFYSYDLAERMHVHVFKDGHECKVWVQLKVGEFWDGVRPSRAQGRKQSGRINQHQPLEFANIAAPGTGALRNQTLPLPQ